VGTRWSEAAVKKIILGVAALLFLVVILATVYSLIFGCPHGGSYRCEQGFNRKVCGCPQS
jgi:hypothetical protein